MSARVDPPERFDGAFAHLAARPLAEGEVHVWSAALDPPEPSLSALRALLSDGERRRADRFAFEAGRRQFTVGRGVLRLLLGYYAGLDPAHVVFDHNAYGKPALGGHGGDRSVRFNLSHSGNLVLYAFAGGREVGIDVETIRPNFAGEGIAQRFFAPAEVRALGALRPELRERAFFTCWTRKEAFIKARGRGFAIPLDRFEVALDPDAPAALLATYDEPDEAGRWSLHHLEPGPGYVGALMISGNPRRIRYGSWSPAHGPSFGDAPRFAAAEMSETTRSSCDEQHR